MHLFQQLQLCVALIVVMLFLCVHQKTVAAIGGNRFLGVSYVLLSIDVLWFSGVADDACGNDLQIVLV